MKEEKNMKKNRCNCIACLTEIVDFLSSAQNAIHVAIHYYNYQKHNNFLSNALFWRNHNN